MKPSWNNAKRESHEMLREGIRQRASTWSKKSHKRKNRSHEKVQMRKEHD